MSTILSAPKSDALAQQHTRLFSDASLAYGIFRFAFGINIFGHGFIRIVNGTSVFAAWMLKEMQGTMLPRAMVLPVGYLLPWAEFIFGLLLILGLFTRTALVLGALAIAALTFGTTLRQDWTIAGLQLTYTLAYFFLLFFRENNNQWSLDEWFQHLRRR